MKSNDLNWQVAGLITFASFMSATSLFFTGILVSQFHSFDATIKIPLLFLIISTFSFVFAASITIHAGGEIAHSRKAYVKKSLLYANNILEFLGLYLFIIATPLVIGAITSDGFLRFATAGVALIGITLYSQSSFSILHKEMHSTLKKLIVTALIVLISIALYLSQFLAQTSNLSLHSYIAVLLVLLLASMATIFCIRSKHIIDQKSKTKK